MQSLHSKYLFVPLVVCSLFCLLNPLFAQQKGFYEGPFTLLDYKGNAAYGYQYRDRDTVLNGSFVLQNSNLEALLTKKDSTFLIDGAFENGYATGFWKFRFGVFEAKPESRVVDYQYRIAASGTQEEAQGLMVNGKPDGVWNYTVYGITDADITHTSFKSSITFAQGIPQQNIRIENDSTVLVGRFLRSGMAQDEWVLYQMDKVDATERWFFNKGILEKLAFRINGKERKLTVFDAAPQETVEVALDRRFLKVLDIRLAGRSDMPGLESDIARLLTQNAGYYSKLDTILARLKSPGLSPNFRARLPYYPMDSISKTHVDTMEAHVAEAQRLSEGYLNNPLLEILKLSDPEALTLYTSLQQITGEQLAPLQKLVSLHQNGILEYLTEEDMFSYLWPKGVAPSLRTATNESGPKSGSLDTSTLDFKGNTLSALAKLAAYTSEQLRFIERELKVKLSKQLREQERLALDEQLLVQDKRFIRLIDSLGTALPLAYQKALASIQETTVANLGAISMNKDLKPARQLVLCNEIMYQLALTVAAQPDRSKELTKLYEDRIWNPFMATLMDEAVKKRITAAYHKVLMPYFLDRINTALSCDNVGELNLLFNASYNRMLELRNEDTKKLERKLRRETNALQLMELLRLRADENMLQE